MNDINFKEISVLLVDDDMFTRDMVVNTIKDMDIYKISQAKNGKEGLKILKSNSSNLPDLILLDIEMPGMDGLDFLEKIRNPSNKYPNPDVPVIMLTSNSKREQIERALKYGIHGYLVKPATKQTVMKQVVHSLTNPPLDENAFG